MQLNLEWYYYLGEIGKKNIPTKNKQYNTVFDAGSFNN